MDRDASSSAADASEGGTNKLLAKPKVMIFGASVAGLTAAHELAERGFSVEVVEKNFKRGYMGAPEVEVGGAARTRFFPANLDADPKRWASPPSADPAASPKAGGDDRGFDVPEHVEVSGTSYTLPFSIDLEVNDRDEFRDGDTAKIKTLLDILKALAFEDQALRPALCLRIEGERTSTEDQGQLSRGKGLHPVDVVSAELSSHIQPELLDRDIGINVLTRTTIVQGTPKRAVRVTLGGLFPLSIDDIASNATGRLSPFARSQIDAARRSVSRLRQHHRAGPWIVHIKSYADLGAISSQASGNVVTLAVTYDDLADTAERWAVAVEDRLRDQRGDAGRARSRETVVIRRRARADEPPPPPIGQSAPIAVVLTVEPMFPLYIEFEPSEVTPTVDGAVRLRALESALWAMLVDTNTPQWFRWRLTTPALTAPPGSAPGPLVGLIAPGNTAPKPNAAPEPGPKIKFVRDWLESLKSEIGPGRSRSLIEESKGDQGLPPPPPKASPGTLEVHLNWVVLQLVPTYLPGEHRPLVVSPHHRHLLDTLGRIPFTPGQTDLPRIDRADASSLSSKKVSDNLVPISNRERPRAPGSAAPPGSVIDLRAPGAILGPLREDRAAFSQLLLRLLRYGTTCSERREQLESLSFWEYVQGSDNTLRAPRYRYPDQFKRDLSLACRVVAGVDAESGDARTCANALLEHLRTWIRPVPERDRVFNAPVSDAWLDAWKDYLESELQVSFTPGKLLNIGHYGGELVTRWISFKPEDVNVNKTQRASANYILVATDAAAAYKATMAIEGGTPAELRVWTGAAKRGDKHGTRGDATVPGRQRFMGGVQFFFALDERFSLDEAYFCVRDFPWALTAITTDRFWAKRPRITEQGYTTLLSVDLLAWDIPAESEPLAGRAAGECTAAELAREVWRRIAPFLPAKAPEGAPEIAPRWYNVGVELNRDGLPRGDAGRHVVPLKGDWKLRPGELPRAAPGEAKAGPGEASPVKLWRPKRGGYPIHWDTLIFAGSYMKTFTRTPTLEAANESGRHAANAILEHFKERGAASIARLEGQPDIMATPIAGGANAQFGEWWSFPEAKPPPIDEPCLVRSPEDLELPELAKLKRIDAWCFARDLPHPWDLLGVEILPSLMSWAPRAEPGGPETPLATAVRTFVEKGPSWSGEEALILFMKCIREEIEARMPGASAQGSGSSGENGGDVAAKVGGEHGQP